MGSKDADRCFEESFPGVSSLRRGLLATGAVLLAGLVWATRFGTHWPSVYYMTGSSMEPAIGAEEHFIAWSPPGAFSRGDLVLFRFEDEDGEFHVLRRLAALPGDTVAMDSGVVVVNGDAMPWPFRITSPRVTRSELAREHSLFDWGPWIVPRDSVVLLSDTRDMVGWPDTRFLGFIPKDDIVGKATRTVRGRRL